MNSSERMIVILIVALIAACIPAASIKVSVTGDDGISAQTVNMDINAAQDTSLQGTVAIDGAKVNPDIKTKGPVKSFEQSHQVTDRTGKHAEVYAKVINGTDISYRSQVYPKEGSLKKASEWVKAEEWLDVGSADYIKASAMASFETLSAGGSTEVVSGSLTGYHNLAYTDGNDVQASQFGPAGEDPVFRASGENIVVSSYGRDDGGLYRLTNSLNQEGAMPAQFAGRTEGHFGETLQYINNASADSISIEDYRFKPGDSQKVTLHHYGSLEGIIASRSSGRIIGDLFGFADSGDSLSIGAGLYKERIVMDKDMTIQGEGQDLTVIDGQYYDSGQIGRAFTIEPGVNAQISDMTIQGGYGDYYETIGSCGGGVFNQGILTIDNTTISGNAARLGGGIFNKGTVTVTNSTISDNIAESSGGGIYNEYSGVVNLISSSIDHNTAENAGGAYNAGTTAAANSTISDNIAKGDAGGIYNDYYGLVDLTGSSIEHNTAENAGGVYNGGTITITNSMISDNTARWNGGGIYNYGVMDLINSYIDRNIAQYAGGGLYNRFAITVTNSTISDNMAEWSGGGISNYGVMNLISSSIDKNTAENGGGVYNEGAITAANCTISDNMAEWSGGGIYSSYYGGVVYLISSSIDNNTAENGGGVYNGYGSSINVTNSTISYNLAGWYGGGIYNDYYSLVDLISGSIDNNTAQYAGGIYNDYGGTIQGNLGMVQNNSPDDIWPVSNSSPTWP